MTPEQLAAVYECLREFPPFSRWDLPSALDIEFTVNRAHGQYGSCTHYRRTTQYCISVSEANVGHFNTLLAVMGHEMLHLRQIIEKTQTANTCHNAEFRISNTSMCAQFGWDEKLFI